MGQLCKNSLTKMKNKIFVVILILISGPGTKVQAQSLPAPVNVSISCDSYKVEVHWQYPHIIKNVFFRVNVQDNSRVEGDTTSEHWMDISNMLRNSAFNRYFVIVTAVQGNNESEKAESQIFSFNEFSTGVIKCHLEFPNVTLSAIEGKLHLQFTNPLHLYRNTPALRNNTDNQFDFFAETEEMNQTLYRCGMEHKTCKQSFAFSTERSEYCISLTGEIGQRLLKPKRQCFTGDLKYYPPITTYLYPLLGVVLTLLFITVIIFLMAKRCNEKIKKKAATAFPSFLVFKPTKTHLCEPLKVQPENVEIDVQIKPEPAEHDMLLMIEHDERSTSDWNGSSVGSENYNKYAEECELEVASSSNNLDPAEMITSCHIHTSRSTGDLSSGYDCPHVHSLEMSPGDLVQGYRN